MLAYITQYSPGSIKPTLLSIPLVLRVGLPSIPQESALLSVFVCAGEGFVYMCLIMNVLVSGSRTAVCLGW